MIPNMLIQTPFFLIWGTRQFQVAQEPDAPRVFGRMFSYYMFCQITLWVGMSLILPDLQLLMTRGGYRDASRYISLLVLSYVFYGIYSFVQFGLAKQKRTGVLATAVMAIAIVNLALNFLLIPALRAQGATYATVLSFAMLAVLVERLGAIYFAIAFEWKRLGILVGAAVAFVLVSMLIPSSLSLGFRLALRASLGAGFLVFLFFSGFLSNEEREYLINMRRSLLGPRKSVPST
jgi:O-antigen/teichoic acid export membrane protein